MAPSFLNKLCDSSYSDTGYATLFVQRTQNPVT